MAPRHPIDTTIRDYVRALKLKNKELAAATGHSPGWASKYLNGVGHATIDDLIRILAVVQGLHGLSEAERRLLKAYQRIPAASQAESVEVYEDWARRERRRGRRRE